MTEQPVPQPSSQEWYGTPGEQAVSALLDRQGTPYVFTPNQAPVTSLGGVRASFVLQDRVINVSGQPYTPFERGKIAGQQLGVEEVEERTARRFAGEGEG